MCEECGFAYSFFFGVQFHRDGCSLAENESQQAERMMEIYQETDKVEKKIEREEEEKEVTEERANKFFPIVQRSSLWKMPTL